MFLIIGFEACGTCCAGLVLIMFICSYLKHSDNGIYFSQFLCFCQVQSVREVVPGKSNNEIVLVLQYYDYNVEKAIQAYLEGKRNYFRSCAYQLCD